jgi:hypothetical protein
MRWTVRKQRQTRISLKSSWSVLYPFRLISYPKLEAKTKKKVAGQAVTAVLVIGRDEALKGEGG